MMASLTPIVQASTSCGDTAAGPIPAPPPGPRGTGRRGEELSFTGRPFGHIHRSFPWDLLSVSGQLWDTHSERPLVHPVIGTLFGFPPLESHRWMGTGHSLLQDTPEGTPAPRTRKQSTCSNKYADQPPKPRRGRRKGSQENMGARRHRGRWARRERVAGFTAPPSPWGPPHWWLHTGFPGEGKVPPPSSLKMRGNAGMRSAAWSQQCAAPGGHWKRGRHAL